MHVSAKHSCRKLRHGDKFTYNRIPDCNHLFLLELLGIILCIAGRVMAKFTVLKLEIVLGNNKTFINRIGDAARPVYVPLFP